MQRFPLSVIPSQLDIRAGAISKLVNYRISAVVQLLEHHDRTKATLAIALYWFELVFIRGPALVITFLTRSNRPLGVILVVIWRSQTWLIGLVTK